MTTRSRQSRRLPPLPGLGRRGISPKRASPASTLYTGRDRKHNVREMVITGPSSARNPSFRPKARLEQKSIRPSSKSNTSHSTEMSGKFSNGRHLTGSAECVVFPQDLSSDTVIQYLNENPEFLDRYVLTHVNQDRLEKWTARRPQQYKQISKQKRVDSALFNGESLERKAKWKTCMQPNNRKLLQELTKDMNQLSNRSQILYELVCCIASAVNADGFTLSLADENGQDIYQYRDNFQSKSHPVRTERIGPGGTLSAYVAYSKDSIRLNDISTLDERFPDRLVSGGEKAQTAIAQPILYATGEILGVVELYRLVGCPYFTADDEEVVSWHLMWTDIIVQYCEIVARLSLWGSVAAHYAEMYHAMTRQRKLNDFLLTVTKSIFQDIISMDTLIMKIMNFAQRLVNADRASLFLLDSQTNELYARIFDNHAKKLVNADRASLFLVDTRSRELYARIFDTGTSEEAEKNPILQKEIRFPMDKGVAGHVASTGQILNIPDAYKDSRFNREVDLQTGYTTKTILCMPIYIRGNIIGVVQMVNKVNGVFNKADEESFETFAVYCGLALHHAKLYDKIRRSEQKYRVALEVLSYHSQCAEEEFEQLKSTPVPDKLPQLIDYNFSPWAITGDEQPLYVIYMFRDLFEMNRFEIHDLLRFTLTVRKNYRKVPYHNWAHAFSVAHAMYTVIKTSSHSFTAMECLAMFVACLCHDLDHRGKNNAFMVKSASPLASVYSTSTMEHHHFNQTVTILQHEGHNIFKHFSPDEYKHVLGEIRHCILATDLALFFGNRAKLKETTEKREFTWNNEDHRKLVMDVCMTGADLCTMYKPWQLQQNQVLVIMEEFWQQGDREKEMGSKPMPLMDRDLANELPQTQGDEEKSKGIQPQPMMDRNRKHELPQLEVGFIVGICLPCYELMAEIMPETKAMADGASANLSKWKELSESQKQIQDKDKDSFEKQEAESPEKRGDNS